MISVPLSTTVLIVPAATPAPKMQCVERRHALKATQRRADRLLGRGPTLQLSARSSRNPSSPAPGERAAGGPGEERHDRRDLVRLDQLLDGVRGEDHLLEHVVLGHSMDPGLVGDLLLDERRAHVAGHTAVAVILVSAASKASVSNSPRTPCSRTRTRLVRRGDEAVDGGDHDGAAAARIAQCGPGILARKNGLLKSTDDPLPALIRELLDRRDCWTPALGTTMSSPKNPSSAAATARALASGSVRSTSNATRDRRRPARDRREDAHPLPLEPGGDRSADPLAAPVTSAARPSSGRLVMACAFPFGARSRPSGGLAATNAS